ncbi:hypothetical protein AAIR98_001443 [Elusimicrobium simillimum]|uniref:terminase small subunit n=1 Tax=Elusimicrobium simillimum TaxID=3143438 RepID=UPI003C6F5A40
MPRHVTQGDNIAEEAQKHYRASSSHNLTKLKPLTIKRDNFCIEYATHGNAAEAYRKAFDTNAKPSTIYSEVNELLKDPTITLRVKQLRALGISKSVLEANEVLENLSEVARIPIYDGDGDLICTKQQRVIIKANELMGKHYGILGADNAFEIPENAVLNVRFVDGKAPQAKGGEQ